MDHKEIYKPHQPFLSLDNSLRVNRSTLGSLHFNIWSSVPSQKLNSQ